MSEPRLLTASSLLGREVRDASGRSLGRIQELVAEIVLLPHGAEYVVTRIGVGRFRPLDIIASGDFVPEVLQRILARVGWRRHELAWDEVDLSDPAHPRAVGVVRDGPHA